MEVLILNLMENMNMIIEIAMGKVPANYDHDPPQFKEFCESMFDLSRSGVPRDQIMDYLSSRYNSEGLSSGQENMIDDFLTRIAGWCTPGKEIFWPE